MSSQVPLILGDRLANNNDENLDEDDEPNQMGGDSAVSGFQDDESLSGMPCQGRHKYDNLLKSLIARIEFNNTLAPIQEYGRH